MNIFHFVYIAHLHPITTYFLSYIINMYFLNVSWEIKDIDMYRSNKSQHIILKKNVKGAKLKKEIKCKEVSLRFIADLLNETIQIQGKWW